ncbi:diguanylate cyclase with PAS/PAC sensor [Candidatus Koribacter versatilis Ellin345]|uniref:Diguanylate cyclase with PAS/PAC sensor n=1 Tax=Koribacter versatilis (strain Ellin345) TaxID=204669 RepID=Q1IT36_KORVE|nr:sensor domain-containing diguanylate cyclase [Candidatus Koribacter versatilis]ABF39964.1 diguanylate cyclase with PAS/PAC sensor [Candidatus Koribacter versatilis Ellin345]
MPAVIPANEAARQQELTSFQILDTPPDSSFDNLVALAAEICEAPISTVTFIDSDRQWFKAKLGVESDQTPREQSFCAHAILKPNEFMVVPDAAKDPRFEDNPLVTGEPNIRFYAAAPLVSKGLGLGALCIIDRQPRTLKPFQESALRTLASQAAQLMELHRQRAMAENHRRFLHTVMETLAEGVIVRDSQRRLLAHNTMASVLLGTELKDMVGQTFSMLHFKPVQPDGFPIPTEDLPSYKALATGEPQRNVIFGITRPNKTEIWIESNASVLNDPVHGECAVISFRDVSDRKALEKQIQRDGTTDPLTGLPNRAAFLNYVGKAIAAASRYKHPMSVCVASLDDLKAMVAKHGPHAADSALKHFGTILRATLRHEDSVARLAGDDFVALFPYVDANRALTSLDRFKSTLENAQLRLHDGKEITLTGACGLSDWKPGMSAEDLLDSALKACGEAKAKGRNSVAVAAG